MAEIPPYDGSPRVLADLEALRLKVNALEAQVNGSASTASNLRVVTPDAEGAFPLLESRADGEVRAFVGPGWPGKGNNNDPNYYAEPDLWFDLSDETAPVWRVKINGTTYPRVTADITPPGNPTSGGTTAVTTASVTYTWVEPADDDYDGVIVYSDSGTKLATLAKGVTSWNRTDLSPNTSYPVVVKARDTSDNLSSGLTISATTNAAATDTTRPTAPASITTTSPGPERVVVRWTAASDADGATSIQGYRVYRGGVAVKTTAADALSWTNTGLTAATAYSYTVKAFDSVGEGPATPASVITTKATGTDTRGFAGMKPGVVFFGTTMLSSIDPLWNTEVNRKFYARHYYVEPSAGTTPLLERQEARLRSALTTCKTNGWYPMLSSLWFDPANWAKVADGFGDPQLRMIARVFNEPAMPSGMMSFTHEPTDDADLAGVPQGDWAIMNEYACRFVGERTDKVSWSPIDNGINFQISPGGTVTSTGNASRQAARDAHWPASFISAMNTYGGGPAADFYEEFTGPHTRSVARMSSFAQWARHVGAKCINFGEVGIGDAGYGKVGPDLPKSTPWATMSAAAAEDAAAADCAAQFTALDDFLVANKDIVGVMQYWNSVDQRNWLAYKIGTDPKLKYNTAGKPSVFLGNKVTQARVTALQGLLLKPVYGYVAP